MALRLDLMNSPDTEEENLEKQENHLRLVSDDELEMHRSEMIPFQREYAKEILGRHGDVWIPAVVGRSISTVTFLHPEDAYDAEREELEETQKIGCYVRNTVTRIVNRYLGEEEELILSLGTSVEFLEGKNFGEMATFVLRKRPLALNKE